MTEAQVELLVKAASSLEQYKENSTFNLLRSYYLMRCREVTKGYGLPEKYFSSKVRCPYCFVEWVKYTKVKVKLISFSKKQRRRIRNNQNRHNGQPHQNLLESNQIEYLCDFCSKLTTTTTLKPEKCREEKTNLPDLQKTQLEQNKLALPIYQKNKKLDTKEQNTINKKDKTVPKPTAPTSTEINVYLKTKDVFSLSNKDNTLLKDVKQKTVIKNNKKKKDKFAGLCQQAVMASAKLKEQKEKQNKLKLFLKSSS